VKVDKFTLQVDFVILDMEEDIKVPHILGRPFIKTTKIIRDVDGRKLKIRDRDEEMNFNMFEALHNQEYKDLNVINEVLSAISKPGHASKLLKNYFICSSPQRAKEKEKDLTLKKNKDVLVNHNSLIGGNELRLGQRIINCHAH